MINHVNYSGVATTPPDDISSDGQMSTSINLIYEDGALRPIMPPNTLFTLAAGRRVVFIHKHGSFANRHYFIYDDNTHQLMWLDGEKSPTPTLLSNNAFAGFRDMTAVGNILIINFDNGLGYARWKDGRYLYLGTKIPDVCIQFGLHLHYPYTQKSTHSVVGDQSIRNEATGSSIPYWNNKTIQEGAFTAVLGDLLMIAKEKIMSKGMFYQPFMVRYALRLFDGSYVHHSAPVPMIPSYVIPTSQISDKKNVDGTIFEFKSLTYLRAFLLQYCVIDLDEVEMAKWEDIVTGIDIFVSAPIYTFDQSTPATKPGNTNATEAFRTILGLDDSAASASRAADQTEITDGNSSSSWRPPSGSSVTIGASTHAGTYDGRERYFSDVDLYTGDLSKDWYPFEPNYNFFAELQNCSQFYFLCSIETKDLKKMASMEYVPIEHSYLDLTNLATRPKLTDDYQTRCNIFPTKVHSYNNRLNASNVRIALPQPLFIREMTPFLEKNDTEEFGSEVMSARFSVTLAKDGVEYEVVNDVPASNPGDLSPYAFFFTRKSFPRWLFYPDSNARRMRLELRKKDGSVFERYDIPLTPHQTLNGAYYFRGMMGDLPKLLDDDIQFSQRNIVHYPNKIYTFETNNPFYFEPTGINTVGNGDIISICPAVRALSQGQFGQYPMYAFSTEGVWAMQVNEVGLYSARQPVLRDVCIYPESITQLDQAVAFATERGIMVVSGAEVSCISSALDAEPSFPITTLDTERDGAAKRQRAFDSFQSILPKARMAFDYMNQRIFVYAPDVPTQYVYSLKTQQWGMSGMRRMTATVNSYPDAFVMGMALSGLPALLDISHSSESSVPFSFITRPLKLGLPDVLKTFRYLVQRTNLRPQTELLQLIHASRDLYNWSLITGSSSLFLRRASGTPYKYFRIELLGNIKADESISGFDTDIIPRFTNRLR